jgi:CRISPR-associated endonuclease/helicase Cas3
VLWIRNTVVEAQQAYRAAVSAICQDTVRVGLLHSRFPLAHRAELEKHWLEHLGPNRPASGPGSILIATQVVEQSVDIDLDFIVSDLAPTDMLLQRMGRLWRHPRPHRHADQPEFWIRLPDLTDAGNAAALKAALGRSGWVYAPYVLLRTAAVWKSKSEINLPTDIRPLLDATYVEPDQQEPETWREIHVELEGEKRKLMLVATSATNVFNTPMLEDREEILTRAKGAPTTPVILLRSITTTGNNSVRVVALDGSQSEISDYDWQRSSARFLQQWLVRTPRWLVPAEAPHPPWLMLHGPHHATVATVADDGRCLFGDQTSNLTYDPRLGLFAKRIAHVNTTPKDDDEFD